VLVSDAERERVLARLRRAYVDGRLDVADLGVRSGAALVARSREELDSLLLDIGRRRSIRELPTARIVIGVAWAGTSAAFAAFFVAAQAAPGWSQVELLTIPTAWAGLTAAAAQALRRR
jgi:hypothetical protein